MNRNGVIRAIASVVFALALAACATMTVNRVLQDPSRYRNREVTLSGEVRDSFSLMNRGVYRIEDRTGSMWVVSDHGVPRRGARVTVTGVIREGFNLGPIASQLPRGARSGVVLVERNHRVRY
ncbi:MAG: hypothetical protein B7X11_02920 [Acidobacteria bacterium 37-65-4]|nr:MAG: hypothetical protein B7X11_02920 [Acidobacteria bacterium 37-65-4]